MAAYRKSVPPPSTAAVTGIRQSDIYIRSMLTTRVLIPMANIGRHIKTLLERELQYRVEGKCIAEGFVRPNTVAVVSYSAGIVKNENVEFTVVYECDICHPVENLVLECTTKTVTKAGIHATVHDERNDIEPITVFVARDHHYTSKYFSRIKENEKITVRVIGVRFELNDTCVYVIAELKRPPGLRGGDGDAAKISNVDDDDESNNGDNSDSENDD